MKRTRRTCSAELGILVLLPSATLMVCKMGKKKEKKTMWISHSSSLTSLSSSLGTLYRPDEA